MMPDREKVLEGLRHCATLGVESCNDCPYNTPDMRGCIRLFQSAIELLKAQEPMPIEKEPIPVEVWDYEEWYMPQLHCPKCNVLWMSYRVDTHYCPNCGRRVKCDD